jgi:double zinc ribbon protein
MEAERPMHNDERDPRDVPPQMDPDAPSDAPPETAPDEPSREHPGEPAGEAATGGAEEEDEFETASWPVQDAGATTAAREPEPAPPDAAEPPIAEEPEAEAAGAEEPGPPPPEAEAYAGPSAATEPAMPAHSVPATEPGESTLCPRCGTENRPGIAFCRNCGQRLVAAGAPTTVERPATPEGTQACPRCGTHNRGGVAFCQNCGANLRGTGTGTGAAAAAVPAEAVGDEPARAPGRAILGPLVLLIGAVGMATAWLLPFPFGAGSLYDRAFGAPDGYGIAFWTAYDQIQGLASQAYFGFAAPAPLLVGLLVLLAIGGFQRPAPAILQLIGLFVALVWAIGLALLFVLVEVLGGPGGDLIDILRALTPGGIIFLLAGLIVVIGALTRVGRG